MKSEEVWRQYDSLKRQDLINLCRYYNGEDECPEYLNRNEKIFWEYEKKWVEANLNKDWGMLKKYLVEYIAYGHGDFESDDGVPSTLKAFLFNRWCKRGGDVSDAATFQHFYQTECKRSWIDEYVFSREDILKQCRYYHGEEQNPFPTDSAEGNFWHGESMYMNACREDDTRFVEWHMQWLKMAESVKKIMEKNHDYRWLITANRISFNQFAMLRYTSDLFATWCPYDNQEWIFEY